MSWRHSAQSSRQTGIRCISLAIRTAKALADKHAGVIAWSREANPDIGEYGEPTTLFLSGEVPDME